MCVRLSRIIVASTAVSLCLVWILFAFSAKTAKNVHFALGKKEFYAHRIYHLYRMLICAYFWGIRIRTTKLWAYACTVHFARQYKHFCGMKMLTHRKRTNELASKQMIIHAVPMAIETMMRRHVQSLFTLLCITFSHNIRLYQYANGIQCHSPLTLSDVVVTFSFPTAPRPLLFVISQFIAVA